MPRSPAAREAFNIDAEKPEMRDRYGRHEPGQRMLAARRLVEAGVRFVSMTYGGWDHHVSIVAGVRAQLPPFDQAFAALVSDLDERGLLDKTLVLVSTEFGRTPKVNGTAGRDHWPKVFTVVMAGGGLKVGQVVGRTNPLAEYVTDSPVSPQDLAATIYTVLGVPLHTWYKTQDGRPIELCPEGKPVRALLG